jgi:scyllo-inositol 2-dehydrogenase (NADP+)
VRINRSPTHNCGYPLAFRGSSATLFGRAAHLKNSAKEPAGRIPCEGYPKEKELSEVGVGLIGFGLAGRAFHAPVISAVPGLRLAAILRRSGDDAAEAYPNAKIVRSLDELLALPEVRLVVIATPNSTHYELARRGLEAGRDVLVDKPFTPTMDEAVQLVRFAKQHGRVITVYQNRRFDGDFQALRRLCAEGKLGRIVHFDACYDRYRPGLKQNAWREQQGPGAGVFFDLAPHLIDQALVILGLPQAITADIRIEREQALVDDAFDIFLHYAQGARAALRATMIAPKRRPRLVVHGTEAAFFKQDFDPQEDSLRHGRIPASGPWGTEPPEKWGVLTRQISDTVQEERTPGAACDYRDFYANLRDAILVRVELAVTPEWALNVMQVMMLARESSERGCTISWRPPPSP